ncbi:MAG: permease [Candidatus Kapabacteria bacterium]|jgi:uncharacterized membrane protein YraQ (UPF0718 family)|nr:permease [Candidatus Kapabacteria bacterium]
MLEEITGKFVFDIIGLSRESGLGPALHFFLYDMIKIVFLLLLITHLMGYVNSYFPVDKVKNYLNKRKMYGLENLIASFFGAITPFCSCSSIPLFIGFVKGGIPLGITFSYLITSPLINEVALALFIGIFGWKVTLIYFISGILLGTIGGYILGLFKLEDNLADWVKEMADVSAASVDTKSGFFDRFSAVSQEARKILKTVLPYVTAGLVIGGLIHGFVPTGFFQEYIKAVNPFDVAIAVIIAVPMYTNASGAIPVIEALVGKGIPIGTALAFMMAIVGLSMPEALLLKKVMNMKLLGIFFGTVAVAIMLSGWVFNIIL